MTVSELHGETSTSGSLKQGHMDWWTHVTQTSYPGSKSPQCRSHPGALPPSHNSSWWTAPPARKDRSQETGLREVGPKGILLGLGYLKSRKRTSLFPTFHGTHFLFMWLIYVASRFWIALAPCVCPRVCICPGHRIPCCLVDGTFWPYLLEPSSLWFPCPGWLPGTLQAAGSGQACTSLQRKAIKWTTFPVLQGSYPSWKMFAVAHSFSLAAIKICLLQKCVLVLMALNVAPSA